MIGLLLNLMLSASQSEPYTEIAESGMDEMKTFGAPVPGCKEQVYLRRMAGDEIRNRNPRR